MKTIRHFLPILFLIATSLGLQAQTTLTEAVDFTITDIHGEEHNLFSYLDDGKYVAIDFFAYWCGPCQTTAPQFNEVYHMYGCNEGDVIFLSVEYEGTIAQTEEFETLYTGEDGPPAISGADGGGGQAHSDYGIAAFPTYIVIAPDHSIVEQDIWPMDAEILDNVLASYNLVHQECSVTGIEDNDSLDKLSIYPNPAANSFSIDLNDAVYDIIVYNVLGEEILSTYSVSGQQTIDTSDLANGQYLIRIVNGDQITTQRLSIVK